MLLVFTFTCLIFCSAGYHRIHSCAYEGDTVQVEKLLDEGVEVNILAEDGGTPLEYALLGGHIDTAEFLFKQGGKIDVNSKKPGDFRLRLLEDPGKYEKELKWIEEKFGTEGKGMDEASGK